ncbi:hypothetical protein O7542_20580 [Micromonospora sp. WMMC264]|uniref:hypothetical protein n=1 Tax=Micromonospora sp. WMMC264 TaxID=3015158 RepID=UPI00248BAE20|nr:hypothetical protein [Micromonospora sp. WMMC264]WBB83738.1 hypothetical protein O7542_20580 [Micromonospora sp. WMMC264]
MSGARRTLGFSWPALVALAALAAPRVALHDLGVVPEGTIVAALLAVGPPLCWVAVVLWRRPPRPFLTLVVVGALYGVFLAAGHQVFWDSSLGMDAPGPAGLAPGAREALLRGAAVMSSLVTGTVVGVIAGGVAVLLSRVLRKRSDVAGRALAERPLGSRHPQPAQFTAADPRANLVPAADGLRGGDRHRAVRVRHVDVLRTGGDGDDRAHSVAARARLPATGE